MACSNEVGKRMVVLLFWEEDYGSCWAKRWVDSMATESGCENRWDTELQGYWGSVAAALRPRKRRNQRGY
jgi:hypothetical protein